MPLSGMEPQLAFSLTSSRPHLHVNTLDHRPLSRECLPILNLRNQLSKEDKTALLEAGGSYVWIPGAGGPAWGERKS